MPQAAMFYVTFALVFGVHAAFEESVLRPLARPRWAVVLLKALFWPARVIPIAGERLWRIA